MHRRRADRAGRPRSRWSSSRPPRRRRPRRRPRPRRPTRRRRRNRSARAALPRRRDARRRRPPSMGQKVHPGGMRVGVIHDWKSNWYTGNKDFADFLAEDVKIRDHIYRKLAHAGLSDILIRKDAQRITIDIYTARPGIVIGKSGVEVDALRKDIHGMTNKAVHININEIKRPELDAKLVAQSIAEQLTNRVSFRRAMKRSLASAMRSGAPEGRRHRGPRRLARKRPRPWPRPRGARPRAAAPRRWRRWRTRARRRPAAGQRRPRARSGQRGAPAHRRGRD